jgi:hypothetical protein
MLNFDYDPFVFELNCCMPYRPDHFVQKQIILSCGHPICDKCANSDSVSDHIQCGRCGQINNTNLTMHNNNDNDYINKLSDQYIRSNLSEFSQILLSKMENTITDTKSKSILPFS